MEKYYKNIIIGLLSLQLLWFFVPWGFAYSDGSDAALYWAGANSYLSEEIIRYISIFFTIVYLIAYLGLINFNIWARRLFLLITLFGGFMIPLYGLSVASSYEGALIYFMNLGDGFVLSVSYFNKTISEKFVSNNLESVPN